MGQETDRASKLDRFRISPEAARKALADQLEMERLQGERLRRSADDPPEQENTPEKEKAAP